MRFLRNLPIKRKLTAIIMLTSGVALALAALGFGAYEHLTFRDRLVREVLTTAEMTGANSAAGLSFNEPKAVEQTLQSLGANPAVFYACVYGKDGKPLAQYQRRGLTGKFSPPPVQKDGHRFSDGHLELFRTIVFDAENIGVVYLSHDLREMSDRVVRYAIIVGLLLLGCSLVAFLVASRLQTIISEPISDLAKTAAEVAREKNYSLRAVKQSHDEVGQLIEGFNEMLAQIQERDSALRVAHDSLAERVEELATSLSLLNATLESTADGILAVELSGKVICYNTQFAGMWAIPPEVLEPRDNEALVRWITAQVKNAEQFIQRIRESQSGPEKEMFDVFELKDGRTFEQYIKPQRLDGRCVGLVINFRDITQRKQADAVLDDLHKQLLVASRKTGMAEVAASVLHNVGNVLNSVSVSAEVVADKVRKFRVDSLRDVAHLMRDQGENLPQFLAHDPKGKLLPDYFLKLAERLAEPQKAILTELEALRRNIEHIKEVVAMQQSHARTLGVLETLSAVDLVEAAININSASFARHHVSLIREYAEVPPLVTDRHKVLQILVNLMSNATHALKERGDDKRLVIRIASNGRAGVQITVEDNGVGIAPENLTRIFQHGFTTKQDGHGFGLHSGALAARELGGTLRAQSQGVGQGAVFTLEFPGQNK